MEPLCFLPGKFFLLLSPNLLCQLPLPVLDPQDVDMPLGNQTSEVALEFDDAVHAPTEASTRDVATAMALQSKDTPAQCPEIPSQLAGSPCGLQPGKAAPHLEGGGGRRDSFYSEALPTYLRGHNLWVLLS